MGNVASDESSPQPPPPPLTADAGEALVPVTVPDYPISDEMNPNDGFLGAEPSRYQQTQSVDTSESKDDIIDSTLAVPDISTHPYASFVFLKEIARGDWSRVYKCKDRKDSTGALAIKEIDIDRLGKQQRKDLHLEVNLLSQLQHESIVKLVSVHSLPSRKYMVMEYLRGGDLVYALGRQDYYTESHARRIMIQITSALQYMHAKRVIHRDIKPSNFVFLTKDVYQTTIKIVDFGFAVKETEELMRPGRMICGTVGYLAPEVLVDRSYSTKVDMWSLGVVLYILLSGTLPFGMDKKGCKAAAKADFSFPPALFMRVSPLAMDLVRRLLVVDPYQRYSASQVLEHPWITLEKVFCHSTGGCSFESTSSTRPSSSFQSSVALVSEEEKMDQGAVGLRSTFSRSSSGGRDSVPSLESSGTKSTKMYDNPMKRSSSQKSVPPVASSSSRPPSSSTKKKWTPSSPLPEITAADLQEHDLSACLIRLRSLQGRRTMVATRQLNDRRFFHRMSKGIRSAIERWRLSALMQREHDHFVRYHTVPARPVVVRPTTVQKKSRSASNHNLPSTDSSRKGDSFTGSLGKLRRTASGSSIGSTSSLDSKRSARRSGRSQTRR